MGRTLYKPELCVRDIVSKHKCLYDALKDAEHIYRLTPNHKTKKNLEEARRIYFDYHHKSVQEIIVEEWN